MVGSIDDVPWCFFFFLVRCLLHSALKLTDEFTGEFTDEFTDEFTGEFTGGFTGELTDEFTEESIILHEIG
jgi:hypothetical protein